jgi:hypothetical protein
MPLAGPLVGQMLQRADPSKVRFAADALQRAGLQLVRDGGPEWYWRVATATGNTLGWLTRDGVFRSVWEWGSRR